MAAAAVTEFCASATRSAFGWPEIQPSTPTETSQWDELDLQTRLELIARAWTLKAQTLSAQDRKSDHNVGYHDISKPLVLPDPTPKRSRRLSRPRDGDSLPPDAPIDPTRTDGAARQRDPSHSASDCPPPPPDNSHRCRGKRRDSLINDPTTESYLDFLSEEGFIQHAKKKKKGGAPAPSAFDWSDAIKNEGGGGDGGDNGDGKQNGDAGKSGGDAGGDGNGNGDDKDKDKDKDKEKDKNEEKEKDKKEDAAEAKTDDAWPTFEPAGGKKKKKGKGQVEEKVDSLESSTKPDAFHEIKLDDTGPSLDINFGSSTSETSKSNLLKPEKKEETATSPWSLDRPRPGKKDKTSTSFGGFNEVEETKVDEKKEDSLDFGFTSTSKKDSKKKTSVWDPEPEAEKKDEPLAGKKNLGSTTTNDPWAAWGVVPNKGKKGTTAAAPEPEKVEPVVETPPPANDLLAPTSKKSKKKKNGVVEVVKEPDPPPAPEPEPEPEPAAADDSWGWGATKKDKSIGKSAEEIAPKAEVANKKEEDDFWGTITSSKKDKKKKGKVSVVADPEPEPEPAPEPEPELEPVVEPEPEKKADDGWGVATTVTKKKGKKGKTVEQSLRRRTRTGAVLGACLPPRRKRQSLRKSKIVGEVGV
ncbi:hypothetical protein F5Y06DRAFT_172648 [Hypoxylon sp. FL0890]|nr:hypothetical protein F5Y06DRAFT_172648 [Hypoxylon sp. FL0890]